LFAVSRGALLVRVKCSEQAEKIIGAAGKLFASRRFHEVRMEDVASLAEVGKGTLYRYFKDKEELYLALLDRAAAGLRQGIDTALARADGPRARLEALVGALLEYFDDNPYLFDLLQHAESRQQSGTLETWQAIRTANIQRTLDIVEEGRQAGLWHIPDPLTPVLMLLAGLRGVMRFAAPPRPANIAWRIVEDFLHGANRPAKREVTDPRLP
jgi:TetR/AcrR family fatty acid metabolism transcriptional regulator